MNHVKIKSITLKNFQGIKGLSEKFGDETCISGENATGKTTINNAFRWLLFDKDSNDRKDFNLKTLDENNEPLHNLEHTVSAVIESDGRNRTYEKTYKEKWTKPRGQTERVFSGHETVCFIDDVPMKISDYKSEIEKILKEEIFKLLTDPFYFSQTLMWTQRRAILEQLVDEITNDMVVTRNKDLMEIAENLFGSEAERLKLGAAERRKKINKEIEQIDPRIDECNNSIIPLVVENFNDLIVLAEKKIEDLDRDLTEFKKVDPRIAELNDELSLKNSMVQKFEKEAESEIIFQVSELDDQIKKFEDDRRELQQRMRLSEGFVKDHTNEISEIQQKIDALRLKWTEIDDSTFEPDPNDLKCPTCLRPFDADDVDLKSAQLLASFNHNKAQDLESNNQRGKSLTTALKDVEGQRDAAADQISEISTQLEQIEKEITEANRQISETKKTKLTMPAEYDQLISEIAELEKALITPEDTTEQANRIIGQKKELNESLVELRMQKHQNGVNVDMLNRITKLQAAGKEYAQQVADLERLEFLYDEFIRTKAEMISESVNSLFSHVKFKLFDVQINGGIQPVCDPLINGVPFKDANNAAKYNAGIDIINSISKHFKTTAPIFIDNREGINEIIATDSQVINLVVSKNQSLKWEIK